MPANIKLEPSDSDCLARIFSRCAFNQLEFYSGRAGRRFILDPRAGIHVLSIIIFRSDNKCFIPWIVVRQPGGIAAE